MDDINTRTAMIRARLQAYGMEESNPSFPTATVIFAAQFVGPSISALVEVTGYPRSFVEEIADRMRASCLWTHTAVNYNQWHHPEKGLIGFCLDLHVAEGVFFRDKENGEYQYRLLSKNLKRCSWRAKEFADAGP